MACSVYTMTACDFVNLLGCHPNTFHHPVGGRLFPSNSSGCFLFEILIYLYFSGEVLIAGCDCQDISQSRNSAEIAKYDAKIAKNLQRPPH